jgi:xanthine dehydrogenase accessory factor
MRTGSEVEVVIQWLQSAADTSPTREQGPELSEFLASPSLAHRAGVPVLLRRPIAEGAEEVFVEPVLPHPRLVIAGGGHVGQAVALEAFRVGFDVTVIDDRPEFAAAALFPPGVSAVCGPVPAQIAAYGLDDDSYVVLVTRGHRHDAEALERCIHRRLAYLGMIGSRRKVALLREKFLETGLATAEEFDRVRAPIGLEIGAVTVPEIAVSIVAQLIAVRRRARLS